MKKIMACLLAMLTAVGTSIAGPIIGLVDKATGLEVPDADLRYMMISGTNASMTVSNLYVIVNATNGTMAVSWQVLTNYVAAGGALNTNSSPTMAAGTTWTFARANVTNNATSGTQIVNWQTMNASNVILNTAITTETARAQAVETIISNSWFNSVAYRIGVTDTSNWTTAYDWIMTYGGTIATTNYVTNYVIQALAPYAAKSNDWTTAFSWGNHATNGYLKVETDPVFTTSVAQRITITDTQNWTTAFNWGNHAIAGYASTTSVNNISNSWFNSAAYPITASDTNKWTQTAASTNNGLYQILQKSPNAGQVPITNAADISFGADSSLYPNTQDGNDNSRLRFSGGGAVAMSRGAGITLYGNEHAMPGRIQLYPGSVSGGKFEIMNPYGGNNFMEISVNDFLINFGGYSVTNLALKGVIAGVNPMDGVNMSQLTSAQGNATDNYARAVGTYSSNTAYAVSNSWFGSVAYRIGVTDTQNWTAAFSWGNHALAGYASTTSVNNISNSWFNSVAYRIGVTDTSNWTTAYDWIMTYGGTIATTNYVTNYVIQALVPYASKSNDWTTAFNWGNHATNGYLKVETDPIFSTSVAQRITITDTNSWTQTIGNLASHTGGLGSAVHGLGSISRSNATDYAIVGKTHHDSLGSSVEIGTGATGQYESVAIGFGSYAVDSSVAVGYGAKAASAGTDSHNVALGWGAIANPIGGIFSNTTEIGTGSATSNGWFHYRGHPVVDGNGLVQDLAIASAAKWNATSNSWYGSVAYRISVTDTSNWTTAYDWIIAYGGTIATTNYVTNYVIQALAPYAAKSNDWTTAFNWGNHALAGYASTTSVNNISNSWFNSVAYRIGVTDTSNWTTAFNWGNHATNGYLKVELDPIFSTSVAQRITITDTSNWTTAFNWGNHALAGYASTTSVNNVSNSWFNSVAYRIGVTDTSNWTTAYDWIMTYGGTIATTNYVTNYVIQALAPYAAKSNDWTTAFSWGNHATNGYLKVETDPVFSTSVAQRITVTDTSNWTTAFNWGNHALAGYASTTSVNNVSNSWYGSVAYRIGVTDTQNWTTAFNWGNHKTNGYVVATNSIIGSGYTWQGNPIQGQYMAWSRTNLTVNMSFNASASTNTFGVLAYPGGNLSWGKLYSTSTNVFNKTLMLTFYANNDYKGTNAYWRANMSLVTTPIASGVGSGTNLINVADATGISTNDLIYITDSNEFARVSSVAGNALTLEDNLTNPHGTTGSVSRVAEFGGFGIIDFSQTSNLWFRVAATNAFTQALRLDASYRR